MLKKSQVNYTPMQEETKDIYTVIPEMSTCAL